MEIKKSHAAVPLNLGEAPAAILASIG